MSDRTISDLTEIEIRQLREEFEQVKHPPISWNTASEDVKKRFPPPPKREDFSNDNAYIEARSSWRHLLARVFPHAVENDRWQKFLASRPASKPAP